MATRAREPAMQACLFDAFCPYYTDMMFVGCGLWAVALKRRCKGDVLQSRMEQMPYHDADRTRPLAKKSLRTLYRVVAKPRLPSQIHRLSQS